MYLKKIETIGFKSFANKTVLDFPRGVTAIVGPNGSGKSNVADAVRWVLGEQSMKNLRGKKGEDVIFIGSDKKAKMSVAVVSLYLDNSDKKIPIDYEEVVITRKLFRNGDSEYLINKSRVRLSDIIELLAKSGVSQRGYCVINQGMADSILSATPAERMVIFEEATGVRRFQVKKQKTINKLETTKKNLERVTDLLNEIEPRLISLKRQATRAQKREGIEQILRQEQEKLFFNIWRDLNKNNKEYKIEKDRLEKRIDEFSIIINKIKQSLSENNTINDNYQPTLEKFQNQGSIIQSEINELQKKISILEGRIQIENEKKEKVENIESIPINIGYVKTKLSNIISIYDSFMNFLDDFSDLNKLKDAKKEGAEIKKKLKLLFSEISEGKIIKKDYKKIRFDDTNLKIIEKEKLEILSKIKEKNFKYEKVLNDISSLNKEERERRKSFFDLEKQLQLKQEEINKFKDNLNKINIELAKFEVRKEDLINEINDEFKDNEFVNNLQNNKIQLDQNQEYFNQEDCRLKIRKLKFQLEQIGGIDPLVVEEYKETQDRFEFLSTQLADLVKASTSLKIAIKELNNQIEKIFKTSFKKINEEFNRYFKIIFGGGKASLLIKYSEIKKEEESEYDDKNSDQAEYQNKQKIAGIEISATPPGKKINNLDILSGGERALTSVAVLFAIISNNPPPFSVLDEIDAALDEANSAKLSNIVKNISSKTQFIIITHNREMMQQASVLYGVTMHDDGVSKIISLEMENVNDESMTNKK